MEETPELHPPVTKDASESEAPAQVLNQQAEAGETASTLDWTALMEEVPADLVAESELQAPYEIGGEATDESSHSVHAASRPETVSSNPELRHRITREERIKADTLDAQVRMTMFTLRIPPRLLAALIVKDYNDPRAELHPEIASFLGDVFKPFVVKHREKLTDDLFFYVGVAVYLIWLVFLAINMNRDEQERKARAAELEQLKAENERLVSELATQQNHVPVNLTRLQNRNPVAEGRSNWEIDDKGRYIRVPTGFQHPKIKKGGIISPADRVGELRFLASPQDMAWILRDNRYTKGEYKGQSKTQKILAAFVHLGYGEAQIRQLMAGS